MRICEDETAFAWISGGRRPTSDLTSSDAAWPGNTVHNLLPDVFESYAKIFHRLEANYQHIDNLLSEEEERILQIPRCTALRTLVEKLRTKKKEEPVRVTWRDAAASLKLPFAPELSDEWFRSRLDSGCWPRFIWGPGEGYLESDDYLELARILAQGERLVSCFFRLPEIPFVAIDQSLLFEGKIEEASEIPTGTNWKTPEYWWPISHKWCVCSDYDLSYTIVGGSMRVIAEIIDSSLLEAIEVTPDVRIDYLAPIPT